MLKQTNKPKKKTHTHTSSNSNLSFDWIQVSAWVSCPSLTVQSLSCIWLFAIPWTAAHQVSSSFTTSCSLLRLMSIESVLPSNRLTLCGPVLLWPSIFPSIMVFSNELTLRWPRFWRFTSSIIPSNKYSRLVSFRTDWFDLCAVQGLSRVFSSTRIQKY